MTWLRCLRVWCFIEIAAVRVHDEQLAIPIWVDLGDHRWTWLSLVFTPRRSIPLVMHDSPYAWFLFHVLSLSSASRNLLSLLNCVVLLSDLIDEIWVFIPV